jgi:hypothetical protein
MVFLDDRLEACYSSHGFPGAGFEVIDIIVVDEAKVWRPGCISAGIHGGF